MFLCNVHDSIAAYFIVGNTKRPGNQGSTRLRDERGSTGVARRYRNKDITLSLPEGKTLRDIKWFSIYCEEYSVNFGDVSIPRNFDFPRPYKLAALKGVHGVSSDNIVVVDAQTILIPNFSYDGEAPGNLTTINLVVFFLFIYVNFECSYNFSVFFSSLICASKKLNRIIFYIYRCEILGWSRWKTNTEWYSHTRRKWSYHTTTTLW